MAVMLDDESAEQEALRELTRLFLDLCRCAGPQPGRNSSRAAEHAADCEYRTAVERRMADELETCSRERST